MVCPLDHLCIAGDSRAELIGMGLDTDATKIETVRIPAGEDRKIPFEQTVAVASTGRYQEFEVRWFDLEGGYCQSPCEFRGPQSMTRIVTVARAT